MAKKYCGLDLIKTWFPPTPSPSPSLSPTLAGEKFSFPQLPELKTWKPIKKSAPKGFQEYPYKKKYERCRDIIGWFLSYFFQAHLSKTKVCY